MLRTAGVIALSFVTSCETSPGVVPVRSSESFDVASDSLSPEADLWVSYQIAIESIDGVSVDLASDPEEGLYYRVTLDAGEHALVVRLDYVAGTHTVRSETVEVRLDLASGSEYRMLDIGARSAVSRSFEPCVLEGAPALPGDRSR